MQMNFEGEPDGQCEYNIYRFFTNVGCIDFLYIHLSDVIQQNRAG